MELTRMWGPEPSYAPGQISSEAGFQRVAPPWSPQGHRAPHRGARASRSLCPGHAREAGRREQAGHRRPLMVSVGECRELLCVQSWRRWFVSQGGKPSPQRFSKQLNVQVHFVFVFQSVAPGEAGGGCGAPVYQRARAAGLESEEETRVPTPWPAVLRVHAATSHRACLVRNPG